MANEMIGNIAAESADTAAPVISGGLANNSQEVQAKLAEMGRMKTGDVFKTGLMGAAAGAQAGQGSINPVAAFVQGMAAGLPMSANVYNEKQKQIESAMGATPFGVIVPESMNPDSPYNILAGMPYELAVKAIAGIAQDSARITAEGKKDIQKGEIERQNKVFEMTLKTKDPASLKDQIGLAKDFENLTAVKDYQIVKPAYEAVIGASGPAGDKTMMINFARMLNPTIRVNEGTMEAVDVSSIFDKNTKGLWAKAARGEDLQPEERAIIRKEATRLYNLKEKDFTSQSQLWREKAAEFGFDPRVIGGSFGKAMPMLDKKTGMTVYVVPDGKGNFIEVGQ